MKTVHSSRPESVAPASAYPRVRRPLLQAAFCVTGLLLSGCGFFEAMGEDYDEADEATYMAEPVRPSPPTNAPAAPAPTSSAPAPASPAPETRAATAETESGGETCGSICEEEANVVKQTERCMNEPSQGPCYCAAAITYLCFWSIGCYAENGADTSVTEAQLLQGVLGEVSNTSSLGYTCKMDFPDGASVNLNEIFTPDTAPDDSLPLPETDEPVEEEAPADDPQTQPPGRRCTSTGPGLCAWVAM
jgi:hypothetical protein